MTEHLDDYAQKTQALIDTRRALEAVTKEIGKFKAALTDCANWMEVLRSSGDAGNWNWEEGDSYTNAMTLLNPLDTPAAP